MSTSGLKPKKNLPYIGGQESWTEKTFSTVGLDKTKIPPSISEVNQAKIKSMKTRKKWTYNEW